MVLAFVVDFVVNRVIECGFDYEDERDALMDY